MSEELNERNTGGVTYGSPRADQALEGAKFLKRYLAPLEGATIVGAGAKVQDDGTGFVEAWPLLKVQAKDGTTYTLEISQDEEGNGPGFVFGLPFPADEVAE
jgi:hypothetical protein